MLSVQHLLVTLSDRHMICITDRVAHIGFSLRCVQEDFLWSHHDSKLGLRASVGHRIGCRFPAAKLFRLAPANTMRLKTDQTKRSQTVIDKEVQYGVIRKIAAHWIVFMICNSFALLMWVCLFEQPDASWKDTAGECFRRFMPFFIISAALIPAFVLDTLKLTNRFAGPISRLRAEIANAAAGRPVEKLNFRTNDYWREIASSFNTMIERVELGAKSATPKSGQ